MSCYRKPAGIQRAAFQARHGVAAVEALLVIVLFTGLFFAALLLIRWSDSVQLSQFGARLLALEAGDDQLVRLNKENLCSSQETAPADWDSLSNPAVYQWLNRNLTLINGITTGRVTGSVAGRLPGQSPFFNFLPAMLSFRTQRQSPTLHSWSAAESAVHRQFIRLACHIGRTRVLPDQLDSLSAGELPTGNIIIQTLCNAVNSN